MRRPNWGQYHRRSRAAVMLVVAGVVMALGVLGACNWLLSDRRAADMAAARHETESLAGLLAEQTNLTFSGADVVLRILLDRIRGQHVETPGQLGAEMGTQEVHQMLRNMVAGLGQLDAANIVDATGRVTSSSRSSPVDKINLSDRDFFRSVRDDPSLPFFVSTAVIDRATGLKSVFLSRRISAPDGAFLGIVVATIRIDYFRALYRSLVSTDGSFVGLQRREGDLLARFPELTGPLVPLPKSDPTFLVRSREVERASFLGISPVTGTMVLRSAAALTGFPLVVVVGRSEASIMEGWRHQAIALWMLSGLVAVLFIGGAGCIAQQVSEREYSEAALTGTLDNISKGVLMVDEEGRVRTFNRRLLQMLDIPPELVANHPLMEDVIRFQWDRGEFGPDGATLEEPLRSLMRAGRPLNQKMTYERRRPDGTVIEVVVNPLPDGGEVRTYADVTVARNREAALQAALRGRIEAESALQKRRDDLIQELAERANPTGEAGLGAKEVSESACDWIWETDAALRITFLSKRFGEASGLSWDAAIGSAFADLVWLGFDAAGMDELGAIFATRVAFHDQTHRVMCPGNDRRFWQLSGKPVFDAATGEFAGYRGTGTDVTARLEYEAEMNAALQRARDAEQAARQASSRLADAIEAIPEGIILFDAEDRLVMCNAGYTRVYSSSADLMVPGSRFEDILRESLARGQFAMREDEAEKWIRARLARHRAPGGNREEHRLADGRWIQVDERATSDGGIVGIRVDVTEARQMEANERAREYLAAELKAARAIQIGLLPSERFQRDVKAASGLDIAGRSACCSELGGDLWGLAVLDSDRVGFYIVDFAGHGTTAALNTFRLHALIHELHAVLHDPALLLTELNVRLTELLPVGTFATMLYGVADLVGDCVTYASAGAPAPFVQAGADRPLEAIDCRGVPLGIDAEAVYTSDTIAFGPGGLIVLYSDMLTDFVDGEGGRAGESAAFHLVEGCIGAPTAGEVVDQICEPLIGETAVPLTDDLTVVCIRRAGAAVELEAASALERPTGLAA